MLIWSEVDVENHADSLEDPKTGVLVGGEVSLEDLSDSHGVLPVLGDIDRCLEVVLEFELVGLHRNDLDDRHLDDQFLRVLFLQLSFREVPAGPFQVEPCHVATVFRLLGDVLWVYELGDLGVKGALVQRPLLATTGSLHKGR